MINVSIKTPTINKKPNWAHAVEFNIIKGENANIIKIFAEENGINLGEQCLGSAVYNRNGDRIACEKSLEYLFPKSMKRERELKNKIRAVLEGGNE